MITFAALREVAIPYGLPVARVLLAAVFLFSGFDKIWRWQAGIKEAAEFGLPWPTFFAAMTVAVQLTGGLTVVSGLGAALGAALLVAFTILATFVSHPFWLLRGETARKELTTSLEHLAIIGGLILVILNELPEG